MAQGLGRIGRGVVLAAAVAALLTGCGASGDDSTSQPDEGRVEAPAEGLAAPDEAARAAGSADGSASTTGGAEPAGRVDPLQRAVVHRLDLGVEVDDVVAASDRAGQLTTAAQGFVADESTTAGEPAGTFTSAHLTLRVPVPAYEQLVDDLAALGTVTARARSAEDVTDQLVDVDSRIATQQRSIERLRALLDRAQGISDVVALEGELARREADLESLQAQRAGLSDRADLATVTVTFTAPGTTVVDEAGFLAGLRSGWDAFVAAGVVALTILGAVLPFAVLAVLLAPAVWWVLRQRRRTVPAPAAASASGPTAPLPPAPVP